MSADGGLNMITFEISHINRLDITGYLGVLPRIRFLFHSLRLTQRSVSRITMDQSSEFPEPVRTKLRSDQLFEESSRGDW